MNVIFNRQLGKYQIIYARRGKPINDKLFDTWDDAIDYLARISD